MQVRHALLALTTVATLLTSPLLHARADCPKAPEEQWLHVLDMQKKIVNEYGFAIREFHKSGNCYEIYGWGKSDDGKRFEKIEVYFNPVTGEIVKKELDD